MKVTLLAQDGRKIAVEKFPAQMSEGNTILPATLISSCYGDTINGKPPEKESLFVVSPLFFARKVEGLVLYSRIVEHQPQLSISLDDLKSVHDIKCELIGAAMTAQTPASSPLPTTIKK